MLAPLLRLATIQGTLLLNVNGLSLLPSLVCVYCCSFYSLSLRSLALSLYLSLSLEDCNFQLVFSGNIVCNEWLVSESTMCALVPRF